VDASAGPHAADIARCLDGKPLELGWIRAAVGANSGGKPDGANSRGKGEVDGLGVIIISRGCFERCCSNTKSPPTPF